MSDSVKFIICRCQGLGVQIDTTLSKVQSPIEYINLDADTIYILNDKGDILCTVLRDKIQYESKDNQDRRVSNHRNGFDVTWDSDGSVCTIYFSIGSASGSKSRPWLWLMAGLVLSALIVGISSWSYINHLTDSYHNSMDARDRVVDRLQKENKELIEINDSLKSGIKDLYTHVSALKTKYEPYQVKMHQDTVLNIARTYKDKIQSMSCDRATVKKVSEWWEALPPQDKETAKEKYNFIRAFELYNKFFNATQYADLLPLTADENEPIFSPSQMSLLRDITRNAKKLNKALPIIKEKDASFTMVYKAI